LVEQAVVDEGNGLSDALTTAEREELARLAERTSG
jgi:hypothetical protein